MTVHPPLLSLPPEVGINKDMTAIEVARMNTTGITATATATGTTVTTVTTVTIVTIVIAAITGMTESRSTSHDN